MKPIKNKGGRTRLRLLCLLLPLISFISKLFPALVKWAANKLLAKQKDYNVQVSGIRISLSPLTITLLNPRVSNKKQQAPLFFSADKITLNPEWRPLWDGIVSISAEVTGPDLLLTKTEGKKEGKRSSIQNTGSVPPFLLKQLEVRGGSFKFIDASQPDMPELQASQVNGTLSHLGNIVSRGRKILTEIVLTCNAYDGIISASLKADAAAQEPAFALQMEVKDVNMVLLNAVFEKYGKFDVNKGTLGLFTEVTASNGNFRGYVKPFISDLEIFSREDLKKGFFRTVWEGLLGMASGITENKRNNELATKITFDGSFEKLNLNIWKALGLTLRNAFIRGITPSFETGMHYSLNK